MRKTGIPKGDSGRAEGKGPEARPLRGRGRSVFTSSHQKSGLLPADNSYYFM
jgi:hypothetical protein